MSRFFLVGACGRLLLFELKSIIGHRFRSKQMCRKCRSIFTICSTPKVKKRQLCVIDLKLIVFHVKIMNIISFDAPKNISIILKK